MTLLAELRAAHDELIQAIDEMESVAANSEADSPAFNSARFRIGRASLARRMLWHKIQSHLLPQVKEADSTVLRSLQEEDAKLLRHSSSHVGKWTPQAALDQWDEYKAAAKEMRQHMRDSVENERKLLCPLIARYH